ncbi:MAG: WecB/TagA/CpsF family glycosyltransferase [Paracoccaceae bacterium]
MTRNLLGYTVYANSLNDCANEMVAASLNGQRTCKVMACLNPHSYVVARTDQPFSAALQNMDWLIPDGTGVVKAAKWLGKPLNGRVTGPDVFEQTLRIQNANGGSVFFLGASEGTLTKIRERLARDFPNVTLAGTYSPPFKSEFSDADNAAMIAAVNAASPDLLWVGMTAPKQEKWLAAHRDQLNVGAAGAVGAAFDFFAGTVKRSPLILQKMGLEWLHRSLMSPGRLGKRNATSNPKFLAEVLKTKLGLIRHEQ